MPLRFATMKWPNSWAIMSRPRIGTMANHSTLRLAPSQAPARLTCPAVRGEDLLDRARSLVVVQSDRFGHERHDIGEPDLPAQKTLHGNLVGGIQDDRVGPTRVGGAACDRDRRITVLVDRLECQRAEVLNLEPWQVRVDAVGVKQGVHDGESHVRYGELGLDGSIRELDERVHDALPVQDDRNL